MKAILITLFITTILYTLFNLNAASMKTISQYLKEQVESGQTPSIQYAFFDSETIIYEFSEGLKDVGKQRPVDQSTRYHLFSITKTFTALAIMQLAQEGKIKLENPVIDYLNDFPYSRKITVEHLLSHTSGIPNPIPLRWIHNQKEHTSFNHDEFFNEVFKKHPKLDFEPGEKFMYSNLGYVFLGQLVERVSGQPLEDYILQNIVVKSGASVNEMNFEWNTDANATGYQKWFSFTNAIIGFLIDKNKFMSKREGMWSPFKPFYNNGKAYGGMFGTRNSLIQYAQAILKSNSPLINQQYKDKLFTEGLIKNKPTGMAHSWFTGRLKGNQYFAHAGGGGGYYLELRIYPDLGVGSVIMFNRSGMSDERLLDKTDVSFITELETH